MPLTTRFTPRDWTGDSQKGSRFSECPPEFLDLVASSLDYFATKSEAMNATTSNGKPKAHYERLDAARARGWAARKRAGWTPTTFDAGEGITTPVEPAGLWGGPSDDDDDLPF